MLEFNFINEYKEAKFLPQKVHSVIFFLLKAGK